MNKKTRTRWGTCAGFEIRWLTLSVSRSILKLLNQDAHSVPQNPIHRATASPKHCKLLPWFTAGLQKGKHEIVLCGIEAIRMGFAKFPDRQIPKVAGLNRMLTPSEATHFRQPDVTQWPRSGEGTGVACRGYLTGERGLSMTAGRKTPCNS